MNLFYNALMYSFEQDELSVTQQWCILSLIYKKDSLDNLENNRPFSLTNIDNKNYSVCVCLKTT